MDVLKLLTLCLFLALFNSCAKISYLTEQGLGQVKILTSARDNAEVLADENVSDEIKEKIKKIEEYKRFFYLFWQRKSTDIYSETTLLNRDAVTYLVIASKPDEIKATQSCFPFYGCFPYLGFFKKESAKDYVKKMNGDGLETYMRGVLAYSTLGNLDDPILSTFFRYGEYELAETIFHELFHTIFFAKNEVDLNENLANFFGRAMVYRFFGKTKELDRYFAMDEKHSSLMGLIVKHAQELEIVLKSEHWKNEKEKFIKETFLVNIKEKCQQLKLENCWPTKLKWNSATFSAFMTYEKNQDKIIRYALQFKDDLKKFFAHIETRYEKYRDGQSKLSFEKYLLGE